MVMNRNAARALLVLSLLAGACGSVSPLGSPGSAGTGATGSAGTGGTSGGAGTVGGAGSTGGTGMSHAPTNHRVAPTVCALERPAGTCAAATTPSTPPEALLCKDDGDCGAGTNGRCLSNTTRFVGCTCSYDTCFKDADCGPNSGPCECRPAGSGPNDVGFWRTNVCMAGNCRLDKDCGANGYCSPSAGSCGKNYGVFGYYCHTAKDTCIDDADCTAPGADCRFNQVMGAWMCETTQCVG